tara:strand:+ start:5637 stop:6575 length:939 start_codon:yes stop_codon:yes gene_type:complete
MLGQTFYHQTIRKYVALFGTLFNDINIEKKDSGGNVLSRQKVPIAYGPKQKFLTRINQDASLDRQVAIQLPRLGFEMTGMAYDPVRKLNTMGSLTHEETINGNRNVKKMFNPSPYIFDFSLYAFVENAEDGTQILEQILPFFTPEFNVTVNIITDMGLSIDIPIIIQSATSEDSYEGEFSARRTIIWTISFMMKGFIYPDIKSGQSIIKTIEVAFKEVGGVGVDASAENNELHLETSTPFARDQFLLETGSYLLTEDSTTELGLDNIISKITIVPEGGANTYITPGDDFDANTTITVYSPPVDYNEATGTYE